MNGIRTILLAILAVLLIGLVLAWVAITEPSRQADRERDACVESAQQDARDRGIDWNDDDAALAHTDCY